MLRIAIAFLVVSVIWFGLHELSRPLVANRLAFLRSLKFWLGEAIILVAVTAVVNAVR